MGAEGPSQHIEVLPALSFIFISPLGRRYCDFHFVDEETEVHKGEVTCPGSHSRTVGAWRHLAPDPAGAFNYKDVVPFLQIEPKFAHSDICQLPTLAQVFFLCTILFIPIQTTVLKNNSKALLTREESDAQRG